MSDDDPALFRILVADNEEKVHDFVERTFREAHLFDRLKLYRASSEAEAIGEFNAHYVDLILLDLSFREGDDLAGGRDVLEALEQAGCSADVILMTHVDPGRNARHLLQSITRLTKVRVVDFIGKDGLELVADKVASLMREFQMRNANVRNLDFAAELVLSRRSKYPNPRQPRDAHQEIAVEIERLTRDLFGRVDGFERSTTISVEFQPLQRVGLSSAVTVQPVVRLGFASGSGQSSPGYECVMKLGPVDDMREEFSRYQEFVRYGVKLEQRVELLAFGTRDALAGIVYSFAGGAFGSPLISLDEALRSNIPAAEAAISNLFTSKHWYGVSAQAQRIRPYLAASHETSFEACLERNLSSLRKLHGVAVSGGTHGADSAVTIRGASTTLRLPGGNFLGEGWSLDAYPYCLVHGDMHGGNVMVELAMDSGASAPSRSTAGIERVCLIDYRNAGPGPRCVDAVALESSIRIADAEAIEDPSELSNHHALKKQPEAADALGIAAQRVDAERQLYLNAGTNRPVPSASWAQLAARVIENQLDIVKREPVDDQSPDISHAEYLQTVILYAIRQLNYDLGGVVRMRMNAWLAAAYALFLPLSKAPTRANGKQFDD